MCRDSNTWKVETVLHKYKLETEHAGKKQGM